MQRIDSDDVSSTLPVPQPEGSTVGYFKDPDGSMGTEGTKISADWLNGIQEEIANVIVEGGLTLNKASQTQLRDAIIQIVADNATSPTEVSDQIAAEAIHGTVGTTNERIPVADGVGGQTLKASQVEINAGTMANLTGLHIGAPLATKDPSAALEVTSTTGGLLLPRLTTSIRDAISSPAAGLLIENITTDRAEIRASTGWQSVMTEETAAISTGQIKNLAITTSKISDAAISPAKMGAANFTSLALVAGDYNSANSTGTAWTDITGTLTLTTYGRPVVVSFTDGTFNVYNNGNVGGLTRRVTFRLLLNGAQSGEAFIQGSKPEATQTMNHAVPNSSLSFFKVLSAGTYTFKVQARSQWDSFTGATCTLNVTGGTYFAYEI